MKHIVLRVLPVFLALVCIAILLAPQVFAQVRNYNVLHNFSITPGGNMRPWVNGSFSQYGFVNQVGAIATNSNFGSVRIRPGGINQTWSLITWPPLPSQAQANSTIFVQPYGAGTPVSGSTRNYGSTTVSGQHPVIAIANSSTTVIVTGRSRLRNGRIVWLPAVTDSSSGGTRWTNDPIKFRIKDMETGQIVDEQTLSIGSQITGDGSFSWEGGLLNVAGMGADEISLEAQVGSPHVEQAGMLILHTFMGIVDFSFDSGIFDGVLPPVGFPATFTVPIIEAITLDYDLGAFSGHPLEVYIYMSGGSGEPVPPQYLDRLLDAREMPDGTEVHITEPKTVTVGSAAYTDGRIYIEEPTRASGVGKCSRALCVQPNGVGPFSTNDQVELTGCMWTDEFSGERFLDLGGIDSQTPGLGIRPLALTNKAAAQTDETEGIDMSAMLVTVCGKITYREPHGRYIYIDDGSGLQDGTLDDDGELGIPLIGLRVVLDEQTVPIAVPPAADYAVVSGPMGMADGILPCVLPARPDVVSFFDIWEGGGDG